MFIRSWKTDFESTWKQWTNRSGMTHSQVESCYVCDRDNHTDVCDDIVRLSWWTQPHSRWQSCSNVPQAHFRYSLSQNPLKACCGSARSQLWPRECVCVAVSASDLHTECLWHWDTLPSQICLKHCHNKPLNQSLVWAPHLKHLCFYCCHRCPPEHSTTQSSYQHQAPDTPHAAPLLLLSCTYDPDAPQKQVWHKYRLNTMIIIILLNFIII